MLRLLLKGFGPTTRVQYRLDFMYCGYCVWPPLDEKTNNAKYRGSVTEARKQLKCAFCKEQHYHMSTISQIYAKLFLIIKLKRVCKESKGRKCCKKSSKFKCFKPIIQILGETFFFSFELHYAFTFALISILDFN